MMQTLACFQLFGNLEIFCFADMILEHSFGVAEE
jgi:hypothetical protein